MTEQALVAVEYCGLKDSEVDHLYGTNIVWVGKGDVQMVPAAAWEKMKKHEDVWREATPADGPTLASAEIPQIADGELPVDIAYALGPEHLAALRAEEEAVGESDVRDAASDMAKKFAAMSDDEVRAYVKEAAGVTLHHKLIGANLRVKAMEAVSKD
jgi:hypothetical protein